MLEQMDSDTSFKMNINSTPCTKSNSKCYGKSKSIKFPEENNITRRLQDTTQAWCCWTWQQKLCSQRKKCKVELYDSEEAFALWRKMKRRAADAERIFANQPSGPRLVSEYIKNPPKSLIGKKKTQQLSPFLSWLASSLSSCLWNTFTWKAYSHPKLDADPKLNQLDYSLYFPTRTVFSWSFPLSKWHYHPPS